MKPTKDVFTDPNNWVCSSKAVVYFPYTQGSSHNDFDELGSTKGSFLQGTRNDYLITTGTDTIYVLLETIDKSHINVGIAYHGRLPEKECHSYVVVKERFIPRSNKEILQIFGEKITKIALTNRYNMLRGNIIPEH
jgi:hypothetical protein